MEILAIIATVLLFGFIIAGICKFGLLHSYSAYASKWGEVGGIHIWSLITFASAFFLMPCLIELGALSAFQFLGFLTPLYLIGVSLTPTWETDPEVKKWHVVLAGLCAVSGLLWLLLTVQTWFLIIPGIIALLGLFTRTWKTDYIFWLEMIMFVSVYVVALVLLL